MDQENANTFKIYFEQAYDVLLDMFIKRKYIDIKVLEDIKEQFYKFGISTLETQFQLGNFIISKQQVSQKSKKNNNNASISNDSNNVIILIADKSPQKLESIKKNEIYMGDWFYNPLDNERQSTYTILYKKNSGSYNNTENYNLSKNTLLEYYDIKESNLPKIDLYDKVSRFFDCNEGDIFKIERYSPRNGIQIYYRIVRSLT
jgi:DNA-directed RNA polymerase subunit H (RpoH/RPB5)